MKVLLVACSLLLALPPHEVLCRIQQSDCSDCGLVMVMVNHLNERVKKMENEGKAKDQVTITKTSMK